MIIPRWKLRHGKLSNFFKAMQLVKQDSILDFGAWALNQALSYSLYYICEMDDAVCNILLGCIYSVWRL